MRLRVMGVARSRRNFSILHARIVGAVGPKYAKRLKTFPSVVLARPAALGQRSGEDLDARGGVGAVEELELELGALVRRHQAVEVAQEIIVRGLAHDRVRHRAANADGGTELSKSAGAHVVWPNPIIV